VHTEKNTQGETGLGCFLCIFVNQDAASMPRRFGRRLNIYKNMPPNGIKTSHAGMCSKYCIKLLKKPDAPPVGARPDKITQRSIAIKLSVGCGAKAITKSAELVNMPAIKNNPWLAAVRLRITLRSFRKKEGRK
jgi:hypothetical protein